MSSNPLKQMTFQDVGSIAFDDAHAIQMKYAEKMAGDKTCAGCLFLLSHPPTFTTGKRSADRLFLTPPKKLISLGYHVVQTNRGGLVTYHGPGQLVGYPVVRLSDLGNLSVPRYVFGLESVLLRLCRMAGVEGRRLDGKRGVFVGNAKIGAIGVHVSRGISTHGFSFNVSPNLEDYQHITACGLADSGVTSLEKLGKQVDIQTIKAHTRQLFEAEFGVSLRELGSP